jgi:hypothetical protein
MVYEGVEGKTNYSQVYVLLVILLLFSQDDVFNDSIQKIVCFSSNEHGIGVDLYIQSPQGNYNDA